jgi:polyphosphate kinase
MSKAEINNHETSEEPEEQEEVEAAPAPRPEGPRTPADPRFANGAEPEGDIDLRDPACFLNRELTWLNFNCRVLNEAEDDRVPLLERLKYVAIVSSNLDEFFMKRIGGLKQQVGAGVHKMTVDGRTPQQQIDECYELIADLMNRKRAVSEYLIEELAGRGIVLTTWDQLEEPDQVELREHFVENIFPLVTPQATDPAHPFPFVSNLSLNLLVQLRYPKSTEPSLARVKVPVSEWTPRLLKLSNRHTYVTLESVMAGNLDLLFPGMEIESCELFRVTRNANTELEEEKADDLLSMIEEELRERHFAPVVRLEVSDAMSSYHRGMIAAELGLDEETDVFGVSGTMALRDLMELLGIDDPALHDKPHHGVDHPDLATQRNIFHTIRDVGSLLVHHPYELFTKSVERFLREASRDPKVLAIKMTLYRTSATTRAIQHLIDAARNGKQVAVVVELKARFDEAANIRWAARLEEAGIHVTYGVVGLKTHCKAILVVRRDYSGLRRYAHVGTGNYHAGTARLYSDLGLMTSDEEIGRDLTELFNYLTTGYKPKREYAKILPAPKHLKKGLLDRIEREIEIAGRGEDALIRIKANALEDADMTRALYRASQAGVRVEMIIRDTCRLRPGLPGLSENIEVISVVGRFLEHTRIYYFQNGGDEEYFIGSADPMKRNLESRVEAVAPVEDEALREELRTIFEMQLADRRGAWDMMSDGSYVRRLPAEDEDPTSCQEQLIDWYASLNKEARRLKKRKPRGIHRRNVR